MVSKGSSSGVGLSLVSRGVGSGWGVVSREDGADMSLDSLDEGSVDRMEDRTTVS